MNYVIKAFLAIMILTTVSFSPSTPAYATQDTVIDRELKNTVKGKGVDPIKLGKLFVPQSRHYSWDKAADVFGIGSQNIIFIPVDKNYRMDISALDLLVRYSCHGMWRLYDR
jgi:hypothetical protein